MTPADKLYAYHERIAIMEDGGATTQDAEAAAMLEVYGESVAVVMARGQRNK